MEENVNTLDALVPETESNSIVPVLVTAAIVAALATGAVIYVRRRFRKTEETPQAPVAVPPLQQR